MSDIGPLQPSRTPSASTERRKFCNQHSSPAFFNCHRIDEEETLVNLGNSENSEIIKLILGIIFLAYFWALFERLANGLYLRPWFYHQQLAVLGVAAKSAITLCFMASFI